jgi:tetratricopeptide (TPR) repeat protein
LVASSLFCLSRGGFIALIGAFLLCALLRRRTSPSPMRLEALLLLAGCLGLLGWFGMDRILTRYASLWTAPLANEARYALWRDSWKIARDFPLWGSGLGTFQYIEPLFRASVSDTLNEHAHNEYLESAVEGGLSRLALTLLLVVLMARIVYTAQRRHEGCSTEGLLLGALFGLATAVLHSVVEFGIHVPAIAVLLTVLAALVAQTGAIDQPGDAGAEVSHERELAAYTVRWHGMAPVLAAGMAIAVTWTLTASGWSRARVQILRRTATYWADQTGAAAEDRRIACLETAVQADPDLARLRLETAQSHLSVLQLKSARLEAEDSADEPAAAADLERLNREHLVPALTHYLFARDLCPVLGEPHLQIAAHIDLLEHADSRASYLDRAKLLSPHEPAVWYVSGLHALWDGDESKAWSEWRRALELSDEFLLEITGVSAAILEDQRLIAEVLPDRPELLVRVAFRRYPNAEQAEDRRPFLEKARSIMESLPATNAAAETRYMEGIIERALGNREAAMAAYQSALQISPAQTEWRYQLAELLVEAQRIEDAHRELVRILRQPGDHTRARILYEKVSRVRAETR